MNAFRVWSILFMLGPGFLLRAGRGEDLDFSAKRNAMVRDQIAARGIIDDRVLKAMSIVPRHLFVPEPVRKDAYEDGPLPIGEGQTISQPYIVALMTERLSLKSGEKVLEIGTGSGYQAAILACLTDCVYSIEINCGLAEKASRNLLNLKFMKVRILCGDGYYGWKDQAPFDAIIVTCASKRIPPPLLKQLKEGGRLIIPLETTPLFQVLTLIVKKNGKPEISRLLDVRFVPMIGEAQKTEPED